MQPLRREVRLALKRAHPGLTDHTINEVESLLSRRFQLDPERHRDLITELDEKRKAIIAEKMPHYAWVVQVVRRGREAGAPRPRIEAPAKAEGGKRSGKTPKGQDAPKPTRSAARKTSRRTGRGHPGR